MGPLTSMNRCVRKPVSTIVMMATLLTVSTTLGFATTPVPETIQATYIQAGKTIGVTLIVYSYSTTSDLKALSQAFQQGQDQELASALSKTKAIGRCLIAGDLSYDVAFIQVVPTPTGRQVTFIASRPRPSDVSEPAATPRSFDLAVGQFDVNDIDPAKSTGFLFPASKLVVDEQGAFHYDLAGVPWALVNVLHSSATPQSIGPQVADASGLDLGKNRPPSSSH
jgi:hypothetical protein